MYKGIFWLIDGRLVTVKVMCDTDGKALEPCEYSSKSGDNFNHRTEWGKLARSLTGGAAFNSFPRGRVEIRNGRAIVWLNPALNTPETVSAIIKEFAVKDVKLSVRSDFSKHYECKTEETKCE